MALKLDIPQLEVIKPKITIFGVGGAGGNALNNMIRSNLEGVEFVAANTDAQALLSSLADNKIQLGLAITKGLGAGSFPDKGKAAAEENISEIEALLEGNNMVFIAAGMGGGTGTGAAPVIAKLARERDILTVGVVTKPFHFEGKYRMETAEKGIEELKKHVDTLVVIPNQNLFRIANAQTTFESAFKMADDVLHAGVRGITDLITMPGLVNLDFADIRTIMTKMGKAMMGTGEAEGENRAVEACEAAISNPLLDDISIKGAKGVLVNMTGGPDMTLFEADVAVNTIKKEVDPNANIIFGSAFNENMKGKIRISVVATGIDEEEYKRGIAKGHSNAEARKAAAAETKSFFEKPVLVEEMTVIEEVTEYDLDDEQENAKHKKNHHQQEMEDDFEEDEENFKIEIDDNKSAKPTAESKFSNVKFFDEYNFDDEEEEEKDEKPKKSSHKKTEAPKKSTHHQPKKEEESQGFGLFNFLNSKKNSNKITIEEIKDEEEDEVESHKAFKLNAQKNKEALKKKQEFFGSTVFDEKAGNEKMDDDILNVPAFFRRKK